MTTTDSLPKYQTKRWLMLAASGLLLSLVIGLHLGLLPALAEPRLLTFGGIAELLIALLLATILVSLQSRNLPDRVHDLLSLGLVFWLVSCVTDIMDELVRQPLWVSAFAEDVPRILGMGLASLGLWALVRHSASMMRELERLSLREPLTGLGNRRQFNQVVHERQAAGYALLLMDLDHFKKVNDRFGHAVGDVLLGAVADALRELAPTGSELFRLGGEEFAMVAHPGGDAELEALAERVRSSVEMLRPRDDVRVTISVGFGRSRPHEAPLDLMQRVDRALYRAKEEGRNRVVRAAS